MTFDVAAAMREGAEAARQAGNVQGSNVRVTEIDPGDAQALIEQVMEKHPDLHWRAKVVKSSLMPDGKTPTVLASVASPSIRGQVTRVVDIYASGKVNWTGIEPFQVV